MMSASRRDQLLQGQRTNARRIYEVIPITECWNLHQLVVELARKGMSSPVDVIEGCLRSLSDAGLIRHDHTKHTYIREPVKDAKPIVHTHALHPQPKEPTMTQPQATAPAAPEPDFVARLGNAADDLRQATANFNRATAEIADELENLAVSLGDRLNQKDPELAKLRRLADAIKDLG